MILIKKYGILIIIIVSLSSCVTKSNLIKRDDFSEKVLKMSPLLISLTKQNLNGLTDEEIFDKADDAFDVEDYDKSLYYYFNLVKYYKNSPYLLLSLYNIAAIMEEKNEIDNAVKIYNYIIDNYPDNPLYNRASFRLAMLLEAQGKYLVALKVVSKIDKKGLIVDDRLKINVLKGVLLVESGNINSGIDILEKTDFMYLKQKRKKIKFDTYFWGWERFTVAETIFAEFKNAGVVHREQEKMKMELEKKAEFLLDCQREYFKTIRIGSAYWATAAVYKIGLLYEYFYLEVSAIKPPDSLTEEEKNVYFEELHKIMSPVIKKAITAYKKIIYYSGMWGVKTEWVEKARRHLEILKELNKKII